MKEEQQDLGPGQPHSLRRRPGRPNGNVLSPGLIAEAALGLVDSLGYAGLTMRALGRELQVTQSALYNHVPSKDAVLRLMEDCLVSKINLTGFGVLPIREALTIWAASYWSIFCRHWQLVPVIAVLRLSEDAPRAPAMYEVVVTELGRFGVPISFIMPAVMAMEDYIFGSALVAGRALTAETDSLTTLADDAFRIGLSALIDAVETLGAPIEDGDHIEAT